MVFVLKVFISGLIIAIASWLAGKKPVMAGFLVAIPLVSMLSIAISYFEYKDMEKINQFAVSIFLAVPLSLSFFIPFVLNRWLKMNFTATYLLGLVSVAFVYLIFNSFSKGSLFR